jgi:hypothetical protein
MNPEHYLALGEAIGAFQELESAIETLTMCLMTADDELMTSSAVVSQLPFSRMLRILPRLFELRVPDNLGGAEQLALLLKQAGRLEARRNQIVHARWLKLHGPSMVRMKVTPIRPGFTLETMPPAELNVFRDQVRALTLQVHLFAEIDPALRLPMLRGDKAPGPSS